MLAMVATARECVDPQRSTIGSAGLPISRSAGLLVCSSVAGLEARGTAGLEARGTAGRESRATFEEKAPHLSYCIAPPDPPK